MTTNIIKNKTSEELENMTNEEIRPLFLELIKAYKLLVEIITSKGKTNDN